MLSKKIFAFFKKYKLPLLSGFLIGTSYIPFPPWAIFFAFVPLWAFWLRQTQYKTILIGGWITQVVLSLIGFFWITTVSQEHGHIPLPLSVLVLLFFSGTAMYYFPLSGALGYYLAKKFKIQNDFVKALLMACVFSLFEAHLPTLFPWNFGYTWLYASLPGYHLADIVGFEGLSAITVLLNLGFFGAHVQMKKQRSHFWKPALISLVLVLLLQLLGVLHRYELPPADRTLKALVVQANIGNLEKEYALKGRGFRREISQQYVTLTTQALKNESVDFVVWPETAYPYTMGLNLKRDWRGLPMVRMIQQLKTPLVTGVYHENPENGQISNTLYTLNADSELTDTPYKKTYLLAYGEYLPGAQWFPKLKDWLPQVSDFERGTGPRALNFLDLQVGPQICYEALYPHFTIDLLDQGVDLIINVTNDSWYGAYSEPYQHLYMTLARAIEVRRPLIRSTNTGISTAILPDGTILEKSPIYKEWTGVYDIPITHSAPNTFYQKYPWLVSLLLIGIVLVTLFMTHFKRKPI